jgi:hypothetical protein
MIDGRPHIYISSINTKAPHAPPASSVLSVVRLFFHFFKTPGAVCYLFYR